MQSSYTYQPVRFFLSIFLATWVLGFVVAYLSHQEGMSGTSPLIILGVLIPFITAMIMIYGSNNKELRKDFWDRLSFSRIKLEFLPVLLFLMPIVVFLATAISLLFGRSGDQFMLSRELNIMQGQGLVSLAILFLAPMFEELGWRGYGVDSLRERFDLFKTTILFACLWAMWHVPVFFIKGYYHHELWNMGIVYVINFFVSVFAGTILMNWIYYKNNRSIIAAISFHFMLNLFSVMFQTEQFTKCIITVLLLVVSAIVIMRNKKFFFGGREGLLSWDHS